MAERPPSDGRATVDGRHVDFWPSADQATVVRIKQNKVQTNETKKQKEEGCEDVSNYE